MARTTITSNVSCSYSNAKAISKDMEMNWINHSLWSEIFVGLHKIVYQLLPQHQHEMTIEDSALSRLVIISSHQLMEIALFDLINESINKITEENISLKAIQETNYFKAFIEIENGSKVGKPWIRQITGIAIDPLQEPFLSTEKVRKRRNSTIHKDSALANVEMARSALYSEVMGAKALYSHFNEAFPYEKALEKYPLETHKLLSEIVYPEDFYIHL